MHSDDAQGSLANLPRQRSSAPLTHEQFNAIKRRIVALDRMPAAREHGSANEGFVALFHAILDELHRLQQLVEPLGHERITSRDYCPICGGEDGTHLDGCEPAPGSIV